MDKPPHDTLVPQRRGVGRWPVTWTTERANPLRQWNPGWGGCSTARRPVAAVSETLPDAPGLRQVAVPNLARLPYEHFCSPAKGPPCDIRAGHERRRARDHGAPCGILAASD